MIQVHLFDSQNNNQNFSDILNSLGINRNELKYTIWGKPYLLSKFIGISHSGKWYVVAISDENIGIDIQNTEKNRSSEFIKEICDGLLSQNDFYNLWTKIESYLKYTGKGLNGIDSIKVDKEKLTIFNADEDGVCFEAKRIDENHILCLCFSQKNSKNKDISYIFY